jgi:hypothetical protein
MRKVPLTQLLIARIAVVRAKTKCLLALCASHVLRLFQRSSKFKHENQIAKRSAQTVQYVNGIPCRCDRSHIVETGRPLVVWLYEHRQNIEEGGAEKSK